MPSSPLLCCGRRGLMLMAVLSLACVRLQPPAPLPCPEVPVAPAPVTTVQVGPLPGSIELPERPTDTRCRVRGTVGRSDVAWPLRTRLDAVPALAIDAGEVTAWFRCEPHDTGFPEPYAVVEIENAAARLRALAGGEDLHVVLAVPFVARGTFIPDGWTDRRVAAVEDGGLLLDITMAGMGGLSTTVPCDRVGLVRGALKDEALLPPAQGTTTVRLEGKLRTLEYEVPIKGFVGGHGVEIPRGLSATVRGKQEKGRTPMSIAACGGTVFGTVGGADVLGPPRAEWGSNMHCPGIGKHYFTVPHRLSRRRRCPTDVPLFLRTSTLEDPVGVLKALAPFRADGHETPRTTLVTVQDPPATPVASGHYAIRTADLAGCEAMADEPEAPPAPP